MIKYTGTLTCVTGDPEEFWFETEQGEFFKMEKPKDPVPINERINVVLSAAAPHKILIHGRVEE